ncbi:SDR family NAD(P)-dependent oxidoreductase [Pseudomarimonas arenosa]|uniref:SDR family NAD(P)-dependent oxidoreductase n=1 Tax=Pseudomarimonas arenosa TaxID=2774145 RepID=A0AAW3ZKL7_9GAMM|nr:SDR family NAD(P)-dependent oxidoreductase [Pseudomarimonas arenosa]MBD8525239.1 SDR family NAD(P)-dependent oxidoreductase [Pseudomarimonas arenosa]
MTQRRVLITGGGSGLGRALAQRYARSGAAVAVVDLDRGRAEETVSLLGGDPHWAQQADVASDDSMQALAEAVQQRWGGVDVLLNNAGIASGGPMVGSTMKEWREVLEINLLGVVRGCLAFLPGMLAQGRGQVINTASFAGLAGAPNIMSYGVSKAGVVTLSEQLRAEVIDQGIRVSVICPAFFQTNLLESWRGDQRMKKFGEKMMQTSTDTLDGVADRVFEAAERGDFMILPTQREPMRWRIKRWFPKYYFKKLRALAGHGRAGG